MRKYSYVILYCFSILLLFSCKPNNSESADCIFPMKKGNYWIFADTNYYRNNPLEITEHTITIGTYTKVRNYEGFLFSSGGEFNAKSYCKNDQDGNFVTLGGVSDKDTLFSPTVMFKQNVKKGDKWMFDDISFSADGKISKETIKMFCLSSDTLISVPAGNFRCYAYKYTPTDGDDWFYFYLSKNVGIIKSVSYELKRLRNASVLKSYMVN